MNANESSHFGYVADVHVPFSTTNSGTQDCSNWIIYGTIKLRHLPWHILACSGAGGSKTCFDNFWDIIKLSSWVTGIGIVQSPSTGQHIQLPKTRTVSPMIISHGPCMECGLVGLAYEQKLFQGTNPACVSTSSCVGLHRWLRSSHDRAFILDFSPSHNMRLSLAQSIDSRSLPCRPRLFRACLRFNQPAVCLTTFSDLFQCSLASRFHHNHHNIDLAGQGGHPNWIKLRGFFLPHTTHY